MHFRIDLTFEGTQQIHVIEADTMEVGPDTQTIQFFNDESALTGVFSIKHLVGARQVPDTEAIELLKALRDRDADAINEALAGLSGTGQVDLEPDLEAEIELEGPPSERP